MGRITVFTSNDMNSMRAKRLLEKHSLPYTEISVVEYPWKLPDMKDFTAESSCAVPQVFFNTRHVGGVTQCIKELRKWQDTQLYPTVLTAYDEEVACAPDPTSPVFQLPSEPIQTMWTPPSISGGASVCSASVSSTTVSNLSLGGTVDSGEDHYQGSPHSPQTQSMPKLPAFEYVTTRTSVELPNQTLSPVSKVIQKLKKLIPRDEVWYKGNLSERSFAGDALVQALEQKYFADLLPQLSSSQLRQETLSFCNRLLAAHVMSHVDPQKRKGAEFRATSTDVYRLQCHDQPELLNSYCKWVPRTEKMKNPKKILENLGRMMTRLELSSLNGDGLLDFKVARRSQLYVAWEEAVCELQKVHVAQLAKLNENEMTAFALNLYSLMIRYAYLKVGIPTSDSDRLHFLQTVQFDLGGVVFGLQEWIEDVLFGTSRATKLLAIRRNDPRVLLAMHMGPHHGSNWSPSFTSFQSSNLSNQLDMAAQVFCQESRNVVIKRKDGKILLSSILKQYRPMLASSELELLGMVSRYLRGSKRQDLMTVLQRTTEQGKRYRVSYHDHELGFHTVSGPWYDRNKFEERPMHSGSHHSNSGLGMSLLSRVGFGGENNHVNGKDAPQEQAYVPTRKASMGFIGISSNAVPASPTKQMRKASLGFVGGNYGGAQQLPPGPLGEPAPPSSPVEGRRSLFGRATSMAHVSSVNSSGEALSSLAPTDAGNRRVLGRASSVRNRRASLTAVPLDTTTTTHVQRSRSGELRSMVQAKNTVRDDASTRTSRTQQSKSSRRASLNMVPDDASTRTSRTQQSKSSRRASLNMAPDDASTTVRDRRKKGAAVNRSNSGDMLSKVRSNAIPSSSRRSSLDMHVSSRRPNNMMASDDASFTTHDRRVRDQRKKHNAALNRDGSERNMSATPSPSNGGGLAGLLSSRRSSMDVTSDDATTATHDRRLRDHRKKNSQALLGRSGSGDLRSMVSSNDGGGLGLRFASRSASVGHGLPSSDASVHSAMGRLSSQKTTTQEEEANKKTVKSVAIAAA